MAQNVQVLVGAHWEYVEQFSNYLLSMCNGLSFCLTFSHYTTVQAIFNFYQNTLWEGKVISDLHHRCVSDSAGE